MLTGIRRRSRRLASRASSLGRAKPDPALQLEQAIIEAQAQHLRLLGQASAAVAARQEALTALELGLEDLERVSGHTKQAVLMADEAAQRGNDAKVAELTSASQSFAGRLVAAERRLPELERRALQAARDADQARLSAGEIAAALQQGLEERLLLLPPDEQAAMQERTKVAMASLSAPMADDGPTEIDLAGSIERRHAEADIQSEPLDPAPTDPPESEATARIGKMRAQLGLEPMAADEPVAPSGPTAAPTPNPDEAA